MEQSHLMPDYISFKDRAELAAKFTTIKNKGKGDCLFYSMAHLLGGTHHLELRQRVCGFYGDLFDGIQDDGTADPYKLPKLRALIKGYDPGMPDEPDIDVISSSFTDKDEMRDEREIEIEPEPGKKKKRTPETETIVVPHYRSICEQGEYASATDIFILSLLLNVDIYTFVIVDGRIEFLEASYRTAPTDAFFLLQSGGRFGHYEALVPKCPDGLFRDMPANLPRSIARLQRLWPALFVKAPKKTVKAKKVKAVSGSSHSSEFEAYDPALFDSGLPEGYDPALFDSPPDKKTKKNQNGTFSDPTGLIKKRPPKASRYDGGRSSRRTRGRRRLSGLSVHARSRRLSRR